MLTRTLKHFLSYTERALTPTLYTQSLLKSLPHQSLPEIMHNLHLYEHNIALFDYEYYHRIGGVLL